MAEGNFFSRLIGGILGGSSESVEKEQATPRIDPASEKLLEEFEAVYGDPQNRAWAARMNLTLSDVGKRILELDPAAQARLVFAALERVMGYRPRRIGVTTSHVGRDLIKLMTVKKLISALMRKPLPLEQAQLAILVKGLGDRDAKHWLPAAGVLRAVAKRKESDGKLNDELRWALQELATHVVSQRLRYTYKDDQETLDRIDEILREGPAPAQPLNLELGEAWSDAALADLGQMPPDLRNAWADLLHYAQTADGSKPTKKWLAGATEKIAAIGKDEFSARVSEWFLLIGRPRTQPLPEPGQFERDPNLLIIEPHQDILKGLAWSCSGIDDVRLARAVGNAAVAAYKKVRWQGPMCTKLANAAVAALSAMPGNEPVAQLGRLNTQVKHASSRKLVAKRISDVAQRTGQTADDLAEIAIPTFDLDEQGIRRVTLADFTAELAITGSTDVELRWFAPNGKRQKSIPAEVKRDHAQAVKELQRTCKDIAKMLPAQRIRIERLLMQRRQLPMEAWQTRYIDQPLVSNLSRRLIWEFNSGSGWVSGAWLDGKIIGVDDQPIATDAKNEVRLWHPIDASPPASPAMARLARAPPSNPAVQAGASGNLCADRCRAGNQHLFKPLRRPHPPAASVRRALPGTRLGISPPGKFRFPQHANAPVAAA
jgi:hypothetical protein